MTLALWNRLREAVGREMAECRRLVRALFLSVLQGYRERGAPRFMHSSGVYARMVESGRLSLSTIIPIITIR